MKNKFLLVTGVVVLLVWGLFIFIVPSSLSRFSSIVSSDVEGGIAFYVVESDYQTTEINLDKIVPREEPYNYYFTVSNYNDKKRLETNCEYYIVIRTTTNLNLEYELYENEGNESIVFTREVIENEDGTYYNIIKTNTEYFGYEKNQINYYTLSVKFPIQYNDFNYQDIIESVEIIIKSEQVVD